MRDTSKLLKDLRSYLKALDEDKSLLIQGVWKDIAENVVPSREEMYYDTNYKAKRKATKIYDSSAMLYLNIFVDGFHGNIINQSTNWFQKRLPANLQFLEKMPEVRLWLQTTQELLYFMLQESNFYAAMRQFIRDGGSIGTAVIYVEEDKGNGKLCFHVVHPREFYIAENQYGRVDVLLRKFPMTGRQLIQKFGADRLPMTVRQMAEQSPFKTHEVVHAVYPNDEFDERKIGSLYKKFASKWFLYNLANGAKDDAFLGEKGYDDFPYMTWRYYRGDFCPYGDSPALYALPEIMGLQAISKTLLRAGHMAADPPYNVPSEMKGNVKLFPSGMNYYGPDFNRIITPVTQGVNYPIALDREDKKREVLKEHFHVPYFMMLQQMDRTLTAKEVTELTGEKATVISAAVGDFMNILDSILDYVGYMKDMSGELPPPPQVVVDYTRSRRVPIEYMGPLAQAQKNMFETRGIMRFMDMVLRSGILQIEPNLLDAFDVEGASIDLAMANGFPQRRINAPETIMNIRQGRAKQTQSEQRKVDMDMIAETLKKLTQADKNSRGKLWQTIGPMFESMGLQAPQPGGELPFAGLPVGGLPPPEQ